MRSHARSLLYDASSELLHQNHMRSVSQCRPIALVTIVSKIFEQLLLNRMHDYPDTWPTSQLTDDPPDQW